VQSVKPLRFAHTDAYPGGIDLVLKPSSTGDASISDEYLHTDISIYRVFSLLENRRSSKALPAHGYGRERDTSAQPYRFCALCKAQSSCKYYNNIHYTSITQLR
jgi:hypothetical protein